MPPIIKDFPKQKNSDKTPPKEKAPSIADEGGDRGAGTIASTEDNTLDVIGGDSGTGTIFDIA